MITFSKMLQWIRDKFTELLGDGSPESVCVSPEMTEQINNWVSAYLSGQKDYLLNLPAAISSEFARLVTLEMNTEITGSPRADYLNSQYQQFVKTIRPQVEFACAKGGIVFKPYVCGRKILINCIHADAFYPTAYSSGGDILGAVFVEQITRDGFIYTRLEMHDFDSGKYSVQNRAYRSKNDASLGNEIPLTDIPEWADITPKADFENIERPLFAYFKMPCANNIDTSSPLGISVFSRVIPLIEEAEKQFSRLLWEFEGGELAVYASDSAIKHDPTGKVSLPHGIERLIRPLGFDSDDSYHEYAPTLRDVSLINGLNAILRRIEFSCYLAYGTLSDVQQTDKTAEEIRASKQRSFSSVNDIQHSLETALEQLIYAMDVLATVYKLAPNGTYQTMFEWDDSLVTDRDKEFQQRMQLQNSSRLRPELNVAWYFGCTEEQALEMMSQPEEDKDFWEGA